MKRSRDTVTTLLIASLALSPAVFGQTTPPASASSEVVNLAAFEVTSTSDTSYLASESTTGTRVATKIADLPFVVNVITSEFLNDFDYFSLAGNLGTTSSLNGVDTEGNYFMRGFPGTFYLWNGFYRLGLVDRVTLDRIEVIKGPNAAIYGQTSPAGTINMVTKQPTGTESEDVTFTRGSFDTSRVEGHANTPLGSVAGVKVVNRFSFEGMDNGYDTPYAYEHTRSLGDVVKLTLNDHSSMVAEVEWYKNLFIPVTGEQLFDYNSTTKAYTGQLAPIALARFSQDGPNTRENREMTNFYSNYENRISDVWSVRLGGYFYDRHNSEDYNGLSNEFDPNLGQVVGISTKPSRTILNEDGGAGQADLLAHYYLFDHSVENKTLFTLDWSENWRYRLGTGLPSTLTKLLPSAQSPGNPNYSAVPDYPSWTVVTRNDKTRWDTEGVFARDQVTMFNGRLLAFAAIRHDQVTYNLNFGNQYSPTAPAFALSAAGQVQHFVDSAWTPAGGINFKVTPKAAFYANYSQSFQASAQSAKLGDQPLPNTRGNGVDYGFKCSFLDDRLVFTIGGYYVTETGLKITVVDPVTNVSESVAGGSQNSRGVESDFTYRLGENLTVLGGFGVVNARLLNEGTNTTADGRRPPNIPIDNGGLALRQDFKGTALAGFSIHAGIKYDGVSYPNSTATAVGEANLRLPAYYTVDVGVNYTWTQMVHGVKLFQTVGLNVDNALNADYVDTNTAPGASRGFFVRYSIKH